MSSLAAGQLYLVAIFVQALFYGIYLATLIQCLRWLIFTDEGWELREKMNSLMMFAVIFLFITSTIYLVTSLEFEINEYTRTEDWNSYGTTMAINVSGTLAAISIDVMMIYRCWVVYSKSWFIICVPIIFWLASLACSVLFLYTAETYNTELTQIGTKALIGLFACNIATTIYTTTAIIYRILSATKTSAVNPKRLHYAMRILAESGILYTSASIIRLVGVLLVMWDGTTWIEWVIAGISDSIGFCMTGIAFNIILIRVYQSRVEQDNLVYSSREQTLFGKHFNDLQIVTPPPPERPSSNALDEAEGEINEHRRSRDGMHCVDAGY